jgi:uncharacterized repeat protein (TIGR04052 family)
MTITAPHFTAYRSLLSLSVLVLGGTACSDDGDPSVPVVDAGPDAAASEMMSTSAPAGETSSSMADAGADVCASLLTACAGKDDADGVGNLCLRAGNSQDEAACGVLHDTCLTYCETGIIPSAEAGAPNKEQCQAMGDACHEYDQGIGLGQLCHDVGHKANLVQCAALYEGCAALCDVHDGDAGNHHHESDASNAADGSTAQSFTLKFGAKVADAEFACGTQYNDVGSANSIITPMDLRFYVSNIRLITDGGEQVPFTIDDVAPFQSPTVALLDFEDGTGECRNGNSALNAQVTGTAPAGNYVGLAFSTSVPFDLNHADPTSLPAPLQPSDMTWGWLLGYKFVKAEVRQVLPESDADAGPDAAVPMPGAGILHLGSTACQNVTDAAAEMLVECAKPNRNDVVLSEFNPSENAVVLDVAQLFEETDLRAMAMCHSMGDACGDMFTSLGVNYETGATLAEQAAFRVE